MLQNRLPFLLSLVLLVFLWKEVQGRCSCPNNGCPQTGMSEGKCYRARYYTQSYWTSYYVTTYYQGTSQGSSIYKCGFWNLRRCTRYHTNYHQRSRSSLRYRTAYRSILACDPYCCAGYGELSGGNCYSNGDVRLVGGATSREGRVEIWYNSQWNTVCDDYWDISDANVVCRQLGYRGAVTAHLSAHFGQGSGQILLDNLRCTGREGSLLECSHNGINSHNCGHSEDASVTCTTSRFSSGSLRVANGSAPSMGRVELWYSEEWNTVCDDSWDINDATVVCRQLGYQGAAFAHQRAYFGRGSGGILLDNLECTGTESSLFRCPHNGLYSHNCGHWEDAGVTCGCGDPGTRFGITRIISGTAVGDRVTYTCQTGYILSGSSSRTCQTSGYWSGRLPTCTRSCGTPSYLSNGQRRYSSTTVGYRVTYTCNTGYLRTAGSSSRTCQSSGQWSGSHPTCTRSCGSPRYLSNGQRSYSRTTVGYRVTYTCNTGYLRTAGSSSRTCQSSGQWSGSHPTCTRSCGTPSYLSNGQRRYSSTTVRSTVTYTCNTGYLRTAGSSSRTCQSNGQWSGSHPTCTRSCGTPSYLSNGQRRYSSTTVRSTVTYTCNTGYLMTAGSSSRTCQSSGQWSRSHPTCTPYCGDPDTPVNGSRLISRYTEGHTVNYTCNAGYKLSGVATRTCLSNGMWSANLPTCLSLKPPSQVTGVSLMRHLRRGRPCLIVRWTAPQSDLPISRYKIQYKRAGTIFWGSEAATAGSPPPTIVTLISLAVGTTYTVRVSATSPNGRGEWSEEQTERTYRCPSKVTNVSLAVFEATSLNVTWAIPQSDMPITWYEVQYRTDEAQSWSSTPHLSGLPPPSSTVVNGMHSGFDYEVRVRAMSDVGAGEWSEEQTQRIGSNCDEPQSPANGSKNSTGNTEGKVVNYFCNPGFKLSGDKNRTCQADGQWSGTQPLCIHIKCDEPQSPANGGKVTTGSGRSVGDTVSYFCNPGFKHSGVQNRTCQPDEQWSGSQPNCSRYCDPPVAPSNGDKIYSGNLEGDTVTYFCNKRYRLSGDANRTCQSNGEWSGIPSRCDEIIDGGWSPFVNGTCSITCGGEGVRLDTRTCDNPPPQNGGKDCYGSPNRTGPCFTCPCEGGWSPWSPGPCSHTCGNGTRTSTRNCTTPDHPDCCLGSSTINETCGEGSCHIHGGWSDWMEVLPCNKPCGGGGARVLMRECNNPEPANGGNDCVGEGLKIDHTCADCPCEGGWSAWSHGPCSHSCGNGTRTSTRTCTTPDQPECCPGNSTIIEACEERKCSVVAVDGGWSSWQEAIACTATCGGGTRYLTRRCNNPTPANGGRDCEGDTIKADICAECPCDAHWSSWTQGICSGPCGQNGTAVATRKCNGPSQCCRGKRTRTETCTSAPC